MSEDVTRRLADQTWEIRVKLDELVRAGVPEQEALEELMSNDPDRETKLKVWRDRGLWPIAEEERDRRIAEELTDVAPDLASLVCSRDVEDPLQACVNTADMPIPDGWMESILGSLRVVVNAAIMDYHNVQITQMEEQISSLQERVEQLEKRPRDDRSSEPHHAAEPQPVRSPPVHGEAPGRPPAAVRELEAPPQPRTLFGSREQVATRSQLTVTGDRALMELFEKDRQARGYDPDRMIDFILYNFYDRPALSFQITPREE